MIGQLILSLSLLIILHEMGHFFPAKWFGTRVEKFYLFFDPGFSLFKYTKGETEYGIGWLPLGGYVKISGMVDESFDTEQLAQEPQPYEFRSKPAWQRLIIMLGGVTVNFLLGFIIFAAVLFTWGEQYLPTENVKYGIYADSLGKEMGLLDGDQILAIGELPFKKFNDRLVVKEIIINNASTLKVEREGRDITIPIDEKFVGILSSTDNKNKALFYPRVPIVIGKLKKDGPAELAGVQVDDRIIGLNGTPIPFYSDYVKVIKEYKNQPIVLDIMRDKDSVQVTVNVTAEGIVGFYPQGPDYFFDMKRESYTLAQAIPAGFSKGMGFLNDQLKAFGQMFRGKIKASESLGGFGTITSLFPTTWIWEDFWRITAILSLILAFMNLLPIPALDGGHVMFLLYEVVTGKKPSDKFMEYATMVGFVIVISLVLFANGLDIYRYFFK